MPLIRGNHAIHRILAAQISDIEATWDQNYPEEAGIWEDMCEGGANQHFSSVVRILKGEIRRYWDALENPQSVPGVLLDVETENIGPDPRIDDISTPMVCDSMNMERSDSQTCVICYDRYTNDHPTTSRHVVLIQAPVFGKLQTEASMEFQGPVHLNEEGESKPDASISNIGEDWNAVIEGALERLQWVDIEPLPKDELLDGDIHPMYRLSRWSLGVDESSLNEPTLRYLDSNKYAKDRGMVWANMRVVLRLATHWITHDEFLGFWVRLLCQSVGPDADIDENSPGINEKVRDVFSKMATRTHLTFGTHFNNDSVSPWSLPWGCTLRHPEALRFMWHTTGENLQKLKGPVEVTRRNSDTNYCAPVIALHACFRHFFYRSRDEFARLPAADSLRKQFKAAIVLVHETAHAFFQIARGRPDEEPLVFPTDIAAEVGYSFEQYIFKGQIHVAGRWCQNKTRLTMIPWADRYSRSCRSVFISPTWAQTWFRKSTWEEGTFFTLSRSGQLRPGFLLQDPVLEGLEIKDDALDEQANEITNCVILEHGKKISSHSYRGPPRPVGSFGHLRKPLSLPDGVDEEYLEVSGHIARHQDKDGWTGITLFENGRFITCLWEADPDGLVRNIFDPQIDKDFRTLDARWKAGEFEVPGLSASS
ncbi:uncharacterized protein BDZ99DRAFT_521478 [Mytilinidion resinicola]|uniref:Uncharacterized protein n=1 Tax=Mytilinidion resinicola TaxID=574789 RepID=A0A6A6YJP1_9PEZI|nr:uncharacterized protein BDZ99DRAFT_521478 [Mytilinidion resinicola]KAF2809010.1 hypothetical protein BDZ99DRAFT_521478 [Mytilinidion resinicola]